MLEERDRFWEVTKKSMLFSYVAQIRPGMETPASTWAGLLAAGLSPLQPPTGPPSVERLGEDGPGEPADSSPTGARTGPS